MNLETIQSRMQDIEQMRYASQENEMKLLYGKGRSRTASDDIEGCASSLSFRFFLALGVLAFLIYADYKQLPQTGELLEDASEAISYNINLEDVENLEEIWYTISDTLSLIPWESAK
ncbi:MAG: hypothetical protein J6J86_03205 [Lachnospiraceae bacterium]|nr:hypothetical protein [Lachnospiraceae bacterium]